MKMPKTRGIYSVNEGNSLYWTAACKEYFESIKYPNDPNAKPYSARYIGSMVADAYRTLCYGGIFAYPADTKSPKGKLRILYECAPMAMVMENGKVPNGNSVREWGLANCVLAGGLAVTSVMQRMLDVVPEHIHDRSGIFMGSYDEIKKVQAIFESHGVKSV